MFACNNLTVIWSYFEVWCISMKVMSHALHDANCVDSYFGIHHGPLCWPRTLTDKGHVTAVARSQAASLCLSQFVICWLIFYPIGTLFTWVWSEGHNTKPTPKCKIRGKAGTLWHCTIVTVTDIQCSSNTDHSTKNWSSVTAKNFGSSMYQYTARYI